MAVETNLKKLLGISEAVYLGHFTEEWGGETPPDFSDQYDLITYAAWALDPEIYGLQSDWFFGENNKKRKCAFCDLTEDNGVTFKNISHAIPENLGNKRVISLEECDTCNGLGARCEEELANMLDIERVFSGARGKSGPASLDADEKLIATGKGIGKPIEIKVDISDNPIKDLGNNTLELPFRNIEYRPLLALRSILRSTWLLLSENHRQEFQIIKSIAKGETIPLPFEFFSAFSPGITLGIGRIRVWKRKQDGDTQLPPLVVALTVSNSTVIWRAPLLEKYVRGPMPPIPAFEKGDKAQVFKLTITKDEKVTSSHNLQISYDRKAEADEKDSEPKKLAETNPLRQQIIKKSEVEVSLLRGETQLVEWIKIEKNIQKIRGDFSGASEILFRSKENGIRLEFVWDSKVGGFTQNLSFNPVGKSPETALVGLDFAKAYMTATRGDTLVFKDGSTIVSYPFEEASFVKNEAQKLEQIKIDLEKLRDANKVANISLKCPIPTDRDTVMIAATAIVLGVPIRVNMEMSFVIQMQKASYDTIIQETKPIRLMLGKCLGAFGNVSELSEDKVGPIRIEAIFNNPLDLKSSVTKDDGTTVELKIDTNSPEFIFERFLKNS